MDFKLLFNKNLKTQTIIKLNVKNSWKILNAMIKLHFRNFAIVQSTHKSCNPKTVFLELMCPSNFGLVGFFLRKQLLLLSFSKLWGHHEEFIKKKFSRYIVCTINAILK